MANEVHDRAVVWDWLHRDPIQASTVIHRVFFGPYRHVYVDRREDPRALLALNPRRGEAWSKVVLHGDDPEAARALLERVPEGPYFLFLNDADLEGVWREEVGDLDWRGRALHYVLRAEAFVDRRAHEVAPVGEGWARLIAEKWNPEWEGAVDYVRRRRREGPSYGIYEEGELVAWNLTHYATDRVVMMGFLHVLDPYRGRGYAKSVGSALAEAILAQGKTPLLHVFEGNEPSIHVTESLGFRQRGVKVWADGVRKDRTGGPPQHS